MRAREAHALRRPYSPIKEHEGPGRVSWPLKLLSFLVLSISRHPTPIRNHRLPRRHLRTRRPVERRRPPLQRRPSLYRGAASGCRKRDTTASWPMGKAREARLPVGRCTPAGSCGTSLAPLKPPSSTRPSLRPVLPQLPSWPWLPRQRSPIPSQADPEDVLNLVCDHGKALRVATGTLIDEVFNELVVLDTG